MAYDNFDDMLKGSKNSDNLKKLQEKLEKSDRNGDPTYFKLKKDEAGNGTATLRPLPPPKGEEMPWVTIYDHYFKGPTGRYYNELSRTTIGEPDPASERNRQLYNSGIESDKKLAGQRKRRTKYVINVLVIKHQNKPEDEGKVLRFKFGTKLFDKFKAAMKPEFEDETPMDVFNMVSGCNLRLRCKVVDKWPNFDDSKFDPPSPVATDKATMKKIWESCHTLSGLIDPKQFKSYEELKRKFESVTGENLDELLGSSEGAAPAKAIQSRVAQKPKEDEAPLDLDLSEEKPRESVPKATSASNAEFADDFNIDDVNLDLDD